MRKPDSIADYLKEIGRRGGKAKSDKKADAGRKNLEKARAARKKKPDSSKPEEHADGG
jgi:hypothetical protein